MFCNFFSGRDSACDRLRPTPGKFHQHSPPIKHQHVELPGGRNISAAETGASEGYRRSCNPTLFLNITISLFKHKTNRIGEMYYRANKLINN